MPRYLRCLPNEILESLGLEHFSSDESARNLMASPATTLLDKPHPYLPALRNSEYNIRVNCLARKIAWSALLNAHTRVLHGTKQMDDIADQLEAMTIDFRSNTIQPDWSHPRLGSAISLGSSDDPSSSSGISFNDYVQFVQRPACQYSGESYEEELRIVAKKLVNKALHIACKTVESLYRRSSIEYLVASTKRMKISSSPSPPPLALSSDQPNPFQIGVGRSYRSPSPEARRLGAKRQRSGSHDIAMLSNQTEPKKLIIATRAMADTDPRQIIKARHATPPHYPMSSVSHISIAEESESESEHLESEELVESEPEHLELEQLEPENLEVESDDDYTILEAVENRASAEIPSVVISRAPSDPILDMDLYVIVHSYPPPSPCQKFLCANTDEVNMMYHCWLYRDCPFPPAHTLNQQLDMGIFCPQEVGPVHLDLQDAGIPFHFLDERCVYYISSI